MAYIEMKHSYKRYQVGDTEIVANHDVNFEIEKGELVIILGASGAGKSTVLNLLGGMDTNDEGEIWIDGANIANNNFPAQLSGGEQQRVSIARAVAKNPKILLCDEPTGALDYQTGKQVLKILQDMSRRKGATVIIVTHNGALAPIADRVIHMRDATVKSMTINEHPQDIDTLEY